MRGRLKFALLLVGLYLVSLVPIAAVGALFWADLDWVERDSFLATVERRASLFVLAALTMLGVVAVLLRVFYAKYVTPPLRLAEGTRIILGANPGHRVTPEGGQEPQALAEVINAFAAQHQSLQRDVEARIREAQGRVAEERNRLAALIAELTQGVLVCNAEGRILLFNGRARELLGRRADDVRPVGGASLVGLGRSVFAIFDRSLVAHALETVQARLRAGTAPAVARFAATAGEHLIHVRMTPVPGAAAVVDPAATRVAAPADLQRHRSGRHHHRQGATHHPTRRRAHEILHSVLWAPAACGDRKSLTRHAGASWGTRRLRRGLSSAVAKPDGPSTDA